MKKIRGIAVLVAVLMVLAIATVAQADGGSTMAGCIRDAAGNIVWCWL